jgi:AcrR family transcriptional regulator
LETDINNDSGDTTRIGDGRIGDGRRGERRKAILDAAEEMFLEQGFARVSLGAIVRRSGGSLATVYEMFGNKQGLLRAVVHRRRDEGMVACWIFPGAKPRRKRCVAMPTNATPSSPPRDRSRCCASSSAKAWSTPNSAANSMTT